MIEFPKNDLEKQVNRYRALAEYYKTVLVETEEKYSELKMETVLTEPIEYREVAKLLHTQLNLKKKS